MLGVAVNCGLIVLGSLIGVLLKKCISDGLNKAIMSAIGLCVIFVGIDGMLNYSEPIVIIISMVLGTVVGTLLKLDEKLNSAYLKALASGAMFDARCFNIPKEEACNLVYWRQLDATRNSIQMVGQANFSHKELQGCSCNMIQDMLHEQRGINWNDFETRWKRGVAWTKEKGVDFEMPILKGEDRKYVDDLIYIGG